MDFIDYYKTLELDKNANEAAIKKAYRKQARKFHPDVNPNDEKAKAKFQQVNEANEVLSDPEKRKKYDKYGKDWKHAEQFEKQEQQRGSSSQQHSSNRSGQPDFSAEDFADMFGSGFGGARGSRTKFRGQDLNATYALDLKSAYTTQKQTLTINGKSIRITIPAGVENGQTIKIPGYGGEGVNGGPNGDLYITFDIANHTQFKREGNNLYSTEDINLYTAVLGGEQTIDTFDGRVKLTIPANTQNGTKVKLKGKGFPVYKKEGSFGDLYITYQIKIPTINTEKEKELFTALAKLQNNGN